VKERQLSDLLTPDEKEAIYQEFGDSDLSEEDIVECYQENQQLDFFKSSKED